MHDHLFMTRVVRKDVDVLDVVDAKEGMVLWPRDDRGANLWTCAGSRRPCVFG